MREWWAIRLLKDVSKTEVPVTKQGQPRQTSDRHLTIKGASTASCLITNTGPHFDTQLISQYNNHTMTNETRQKILKATSSLFERQGYHATGLNQIVEESNTPRGSLYYYFPDGKEELAAEAVRQRTNEVIGNTRRMLSDIDDPIEAIHTMILEASRHCIQNDCSTGAPIAAVALEASNTSERIRQACAAHYQELEGLLAAKLVMGGFSAEKAASLASTIHAAIEGAMIISRTKQDAAILVTVAHNMKILLQNTPKS